MKKMEFTQMEQLTGGGSGRTCMILGGLAFACFCGGFLNPGGFWAASALSGMATVYGCFN